MSYRFMRLLVFFDLPTITAQDKREYRAFRKLLIKNGFFMMQESVYCRMILNKGQEEAIVSILLKISPRMDWSSSYRLRKSSFPILSALREVLRRMYSLVMNGWWFCEAPHSRLSNQFNMERLFRSHPHY